MKKKCSAWGLMVMVWALSGLELKAQPPVPSSAPTAPSALKVLHLTFQAAETGFDPAKVSDYYSAVVISGIFDPLLTYDYLARPAHLIPNVSEALPTISADGKTYTLKIKQGIVFGQDPVFAGRARPLRAQDYLYSIKRFVDPKNRSPYAFLFLGKIVGLDALVSKAQKTGQFDYDAAVEGLQAPDPFTLSIKLTETDFNFSHVLAFPLVGAVAREVIERYGADSSAHPVGTGPYRLRQYLRSSKISLEKNPLFRTLRWEALPTTDIPDEAIRKSMQGKLLPAIDRIEISIMDEAQSRWLAFLRAETDMEYQLEELAPKFLTPTGELKSPFREQGIQLDRSVDPEISYLFFNTAETIGNQPNPIGGFTLPKIALRRAIAMAYDVQDQIAVIRKGQSVRAFYPIPPGVAGHQSQYRSSLSYNPALANALLDQFGYRRGADGYRSHPDGSALMLEYASTPVERDRQFDELMKRSMDRIGLRLSIRKQRFSELLKLSSQCRLMMKQANWIADYPDGDNFMQLLYGPHTGQSNAACYRSASFDRRYEQSRRLPDGAKRDLLYLQMTRQMEADTAWLLTDSRYRNVLLQPYVVGFKKHPVLTNEWIHMDIDRTRMKKAPAS
jgi:ABC-type transport system substrate-binding protein